MQRREFLAASAATIASLQLVRAEHSSHPNTYSSPKAAMESPREKLLYVPALYVGTGIEKPDYLATVDVDPLSPNYGKVIHRLPMPYVGDELHHFGWNACSSCHGDAELTRRYLIVPGLRSSRIHIVDVADPARPKLHKVIEPQDVLKTNLSSPHTVHCLPDGNIMLSMLGDAKGNGPGGFLLLNQDFEVVGRWERDAGKMAFNYDFWYQPRYNVMVSSEWAAPNTVSPGFNLDDVKAGKYGKQLHFWDWSERKVIQSVDVGDQGMIPLEVRFHHNPDSTHGYVGAALSSSVWHWHKGDSSWKSRRSFKWIRWRWKAGRSPCLASSQTFCCRWTTAGCTFRTGCTATSGSTTLVTPAAPVWPVRFGSEACLGKLPQRKTSLVGPRCSNSASMANGCTSPTRCTAVGITSSTRRLPRRVRTCCPSTAIRKMVGFR